MRRLVKNPKGSILCFVGPPGVGKTSLGMSIAKATGRKFVRMSLGGVRDEAEIRGHRRTYIGALPGQIIQMMKKSGTQNPVFMLDEIDKMSMDFRGDPSAALLEVLDPEQNYMFVDHYLDVEYDLSQVFFIATANVLHTIPPALQDRMEVIRLSGYTELEKMEIAKRFLVGKQTEDTGLDDKQIEFTGRRPSDADPVLHARSRCPQPGARDRQCLPQDRAQGGECSQRREASRNCPTSGHHAREAVRNCSDRRSSATCRPIRRTRSAPLSGLAWTEVGGQILTTEATTDGRPRQAEHHGQARRRDAGIGAGGDELSSQSRAHLFGLPRDFYRHLDIHVHVPEGAIPKDGPSAGITIATSICSAR